MSIRHTNAHIVYFWYYTMWLKWVKEYTLYRHFAVPSVFTLDFKLQHPKYVEIWKKAYLFVFKTMWIIWVIFATEFMLNLLLQPLSYILTLT